jgi:hypothetical protein
MAMMTEVEVVVSPGVWTLMSAIEAKKQDIKIADRRCPECKGRIALLPNSKTFVATGNIVAGRKKFTVA